LSSLPLELPTIQNWSCHNCGGCCKQHGIFITEAEKERIEKQGWTEEHGIPRGQSIFVRMGGWLGKSWHRLAHQPDGACVFLDDKGLCRIHARFGEPAKPLACRIYPYAFHPAGSKVTVGLRFSCPSVVANRGRTMQAQRQEIKDLARQVVPESVSRATAPLIADGTIVEWADFHRFTSAIDDILSQSEQPFWRRLVALIGMMDVLEQAKFDKLNGARLEEFLEIVSEGVSQEGPEALDAVDPPSNLGRTQFRLLAGQYARKDTYASADGSLRGRFGLLRSALKLTRGRGLTPVLQPALKEVPFDQLEQPRGFPDESHELFERYFRIKVQGLSFCGAAYYQVPLVEGFRSLALVYPAVLWIARWLAASRGDSVFGATDVADALAIADHHHGYSPAFGTWGFRKRVQTMAKLGDIPRLCCWYTR
jgi:lysine-N-methylase